MKVSEMIKRLEAIKAKHGDGDVEWVCHHCLCTFVPKVELQSKRAVETLTNG